MQPLRVHVLLLALASACQAEATQVSQQKIEPKLEDVASDKKFFGPPFPADYPEDKRPVPNKSILDKLKGPDQPYPSLQSKEDFDRDYVKDENSDTGAWQAQFEYDSLRRKLFGEEGDARRAQERADREGADADGAQKDDDSAAGRVRDAQKEVDDALGEEEKAKTAEDFDGPPSDEKLRELKQAIRDAESRYEKEKQDFEECKRQLEQSKKELEELRAKHKEMEEKLAADTKLWAEQKAVKMNLRKVQQTAATEKVKAAMEKLRAAEKVKNEAEEKLAKQKAEHDTAKKSLQKEKADLESVKNKLDAASTKLQKIHGYKPAEPTPQLPKSSARKASAAAVLSLLVLASMLVSMW